MGGDVNQSSVPRAEDEEEDAVVRLDEALFFLRMSSRMQRISCSVALVSLDAPFRLEVACLFGSSRGFDIVDSIEAKCSEKLRSSGSEIKSRDRQNAQAQL
jgi:hypothetical protein